MTTTKETTIQEQILVLPENQWISIGNLDFDTAHLKALVTERDAYKAALERIREEHNSLHCCEMAEIARQALEGVSKDGNS